jgi:hypothetical protein
MLWDFVNSVMLSSLTGYEYLSTYGGPIVPFYVRIFPIRDIL